MTSRLWIRVLLALIVLVWFGPVLIGGRPLGGNITSVYLPQMFHYDRALSEGRLPLWNEMSDFGVPVLAEGQIGTLYPIHWLLYGALEPWNAYTLSMVLHFMLAGWFAYLCGRGFALSRPAAALAALVFVGQGFFTSHLDESWSYTSGCWLPLAVLAAWRWLRRGAWHWLLGLVLVVSMQILAGHFQIAFFTAVVVLLLGVLSCLLVPQPRLVVLRRALLLPAALCGAVAAAAVQLLPTAEWIAQADTRGRGESFLASFAMPPLHLARYLAPGFLQDPLWEPVAWAPWRSSPKECLPYVGLLPFGLALWSLSAFRQREEVRVVGCLAALGVALSLGPYLPGFAWLTELPGFGWFSATGRWSIVCGLFLGLLAGWGLDRISLKKFAEFFPRFSLVAGFILAIAVALIVATTRMSPHYDQPPSEYVGIRQGLNLLSYGYERAELATITPANRLSALLLSELALPAINLALLALAAWAAPRLLADKRRLALLVLGWSFVDLTWHAVRLRNVEFVDHDLSSPVLDELAPSETQRVAGTVGGLAGVVKSAALRPAPPDLDRYWDEQFRSEAMELWDGSPPTVPPLARWGDWGTRLGRNSREGFRDDDLVFLQLSGIRSLVCGYSSKTPSPDGPMRKTFSGPDDWLSQRVFGSGIEQFRRGNEWTIWTPRAAPAARAWTFPVTDPPAPGSDPRLLTRPPPARRNMLKAARPAAHVTDEGERLIVQGTTDTPAVLVLSDLHYSGWKAVLTSGQTSTPVPIERAFGRWRAIHLPVTGAYQVTFTYRPDSFRVGRLISLGALLIWSLGFLAAMVYRRRRRASADDRCPAGYSER